jgi:hypothetical protein
VTGADSDAALDAALALGADKWFCFPCLKDKRPAMPHGFKHAQSDPSALRELWRRYPGPLVGVATGAVAVITAAALRAGLNQREAERTTRSGVGAGAGIANV